MERIIRKQNYKNAFNCKKCPATDDENGCPDWWRWEEKNEKGEARIVEQCGRSAAKYFELQRLSNTRFVVDNVVATRNTIAETAQNVLKFFGSRPVLEVLDDVPQQAIDFRIAAPIGHGAQITATSDSAGTSIDGNTPPCQRPEFSGY